MDIVKHKIYARHNRAVKSADRLSVFIIKRCIRTVLSCEGVDLPCEVSVLITDDHAIRGINNEFRGVDAPTDVLSFPMLVFSPPGWAAPDIGASDPETGLIPLGEIILSGRRVHEQAKVFGHSPERETAYLVVHSVLHLLGYDHLDEAEGKKEMRGREKEIIREMSLKS